MLYGEDFGATEVDAGRETTSIFLPLKSLSGNSVRPSVSVNRRKKLN